MTLDTRVVDATAPGGVAQITKRAADTFKVQVNWDDAMPDPVYFYSWEAPPLESEKINTMTSLGVIASNTYIGAGYHFNGSVAQASVQRSISGGSWAPLLGAGVPQQGENNGAAAHNVLNGLWVRNSTDIWIVGYYRNLSDMLRRPLVYRYNYDAGTWVTMDVPSVTVNGVAQPTILTSIHGTSATDVWAVGWSFNGSKRRTVIMRWNGTAWSIVTSPNPTAQNCHLQGVKAISGSLAWAVGYSCTDQQTSSQELYTSGSMTAVVLKWNGTSWSDDTSNLPAITGGGSLSAIDAVDANNVYAVGTRNWDNLGDRAGLVLKHNGTTWSALTPNAVGTSDNYLTSVFALDSTHIYVAGHSNVTDQTWDDQGPLNSLIETYNGTTWTTETSANLGSASRTELYAIAAFSSTQINALGRVYMTSGKEYRYGGQYLNAGTWTISTGFTLHAGSTSTTAPTITLTQPPDPDNDVPRTSEMIVAGGSAGWSGRLEVVAFLSDAVTPRTMTQTFRISIV